MTMAGHMPPPLFSYLPLAALALTSFSITEPGWFASLAGHHFSPLVSAYCCLPQTCTQVIWPLAHFSRGIQCKVQRMSAAQGQNTFQSQLTVLVTLPADQSRYHPVLPLDPLIPAITSPNFATLFLLNFPNIFTGFNIVRI